MRSHYVKDNHVWRGDSIGFHYLKLKKSFKRDRIRKVVLFAELKRPVYNSFWFHYVQKYLGSISSKKTLLSKFIECMKKLEKVNLKLNSESNVKRITFEI